MPAMQVTRVHELLVDADRLYFRGRWQCDGRELPYLDADFFDVSFLVLEPHVTLNHALHDYVLQRCCVSMHSDPRGGPNPPCGSRVLADRVVAFHALRAGRVREALGAPPPYAVCEVAQPLGTRALVDLHQFFTVDAARGVASVAAVLLDGLLAHGAARSATAADGPQIRRLVLAATTADTTTPAAASVAAPSVAAAVVEPTAAASMDAAAPQTPPLQAAAAAPAPSTTTTTIILLPPTAALLAAGGRAACLAPSPAKARAAAAASSAQPEEVDPSAVDALLALGRHPMPQPLRAATVV
jgi:hypothetical protein